MSTTIFTLLTEWISNSSMIVNLYAALSTGVSLAISMDAALTALPVTYATFRYEALGRRAPAASAAASAPADLPAAAFPQAAAAAVSSQALAEASSPTNTGSQSRLPCSGHHSCRRHFCRVNPRNHRAWSPPDCVSKVFTASPD